MVPAVVRTAGTTLGERMGSFGNADSCAVDRMISVMRDGPRRRSATVDSSAGVAAPFGWLFGVMDCVIRSFPRVSIGPAGGACRCLRWVSDVCPGATKRKRFIASGSVVGIELASGCNPCG